MEQGVLNAGLQPAQVGAAPDEVPLCPEAGKPVPQMIGGIPPDRRVAVQSERLAKDLDGQRLNVRQRRRRPTAAQTGPPRICRTASSITQYSQTKRSSRSMDGPPQCSGTLENVPHRPIPRGRLFEVTILHL